MSQSTSSDDVHNYFMSIAFVTGLRSNDPSTKVGSCIVNEEGKIVGVGYNRLTKNVSGLETGTPSNSKVRRVDDPNNLVRLDMWLKTKHPYIVYAEMDAILNAKTQSLKGSTLYTLIYPWNECAKLIVESGIKEVIYYSDKYKGNEYRTAAQKIFELEGVKMTSFKTGRKEVKEELQYLARRTVEIPK